MTHRVIPAYEAGRSARSGGCPTGENLKAYILDYDIIKFAAIPIFLDAARNTPAATAPALPMATQNTVKRFAAQGYVKVQSVPASREVVVLRKDNKQVLSSGKSGPNGFFTLPWRSYAGEVLVLVLEDNGGGYNAKIFDLLVAEEN